MIDRLPAGRRYLAVDLPLHGGTPPAADYSLADFVVAFAQALGLSGIDLVGNDTGGGRELQRFIAGLRPDDLEAAAPRLAELAVPTLLIWGTGDRFFHVRHAYRLRDLIPGATRVVEVPGARLFFPDERPDALATPLAEFWTSF